MLTCWTHCTTRTTTSCHLARSTWHDTWWTKWPVTTQSYSSMETHYTGVSSSSAALWAAWQLSWRNRRLPLSTLRMWGSTFLAFLPSTPTLAPSSSVAVPMQVYSCCLIDVFVFFIFLFLGTCQIAPQPQFRYGTCMRVPKEAFTWCTCNIRFTGYELYHSLEN